MQRFLYRRRFLVQAKVFLALTLALPGPVLAGGGGPVPVSPRHAGRVVNVTLGDSVRVDVGVHPGDTLLVHVEENRIEDFRRWTVPGVPAPLRLVKRSEESQGDHGYSSLVYDVTYTYTVSTTATGSHTLPFSLDYSPDVLASLNAEGLDRVAPQVFYLTVSVR